MKSSDVEIQLAGQIKVSGCLGLLIGSLVVEILALTPLTDDIINIPLFKVTQHGLMAQCDQNR